MSGAKTPTSAQTLVALLQQRAAMQADCTAYILLSDGEAESCRLSYADLDRGARRIASVLSERAVPGDRALLVFPHGADYLQTFFGCLYAGIVAVPAYPPSPVRPERALERLQAIVSSAAPRLVLGPDDETNSLRRAVADRPAWRASHFLGTSAWQAGRGGEDFQSGAVEPGTLAFLQYTSGSTSAPKGVMVGHGNLIANLAQIRAGFGHDETTVFVSWLPLYHDMGLIGGMLQPLFLGIPCVLMAPVDFLQRPMRWLEAVSRYRATTSGGPNFAFDLCTRRATPAAVSALDLSSWKVAFNGSEPVRARTLDDFARTFAPAGFDRRALYPCYGLAEATLFVSGGRPGEAPRRLRCDPAELERGRAIASDRADARDLISCGLPWSQEVLVVDPKTGTPMADGGVGEVWVSGANVASGYWGNDDATAATFVDGPVERPGQFLRTGDLGFVDRGQLFVTGRIKDLIILRGRNLYPQDLEQSAEQAHPALHAGGVAALSVEDAQGIEGIVIVAEIDRHHRQTDLVTVERSVRSAIIQQHEAAVDQVVFIRPGTLPKTSSGKIRRAACREAFVGRSLQLLDGGSERPGALPCTPRAALVEILAGIARLPAGQVEPTKALQDHGLDSLGLLEFHATVEERFGVTLPMRRLFDGASLSDIEQGWTAWPMQTRAADVGADVGAALPLSASQRALWIDAASAPESAAHHVAAALSVDGPCDDAALTDAWQLLTERHDVMRLTIATENGEPLQRVHPTRHAAPTFRDARAWDTDALQRQLHLAARRPFDITGGTDTLFRLDAFRQVGGRQVLLLAAHHVVVDLASAARLLAELQEMLAARHENRLPVLERTARSWGTDLTQQAAQHAGAESDWPHWQRRLVDPLPVFDPPTDRPRGATRTWRGGRHRFALDAACSEGVEAMARHLGITSHVLLLGIYQLALHHWTGQDDLLVGMPSAAATSLAPGAPLGYHVQPLPLRSRFDSAQRLDAWLRGQQVQLADALAQRAMPFATLVERLVPERDRSRPALVQAWFALQRACGPQGAVLAPLLLGAPVAVDRGGLRWTALPLDERDVAAELTLVMVQTPSGLCGQWEYAAELFDAATVRRLHGRWCALLDAVLATPAACLGDLPRLAESEREALLALGRGPHAPTIHGNLASHFLRSAQAHADQTALDDGEQRLSYRDLASRAVRGAQAMRSRGVRTGDRVALGMSGSAELVVAILATLCADAIYVPLDPAYPSARLTQMLADAQPRLVVTGSSPNAVDAAATALDLPSTPLADLVDAGGGAQADAKLATVDAEAPAYLLYTSGSTGEPKGVLCRHGGALNLVADFDGRQPLRPGERCSWWTSPSFDVSVWEVFAPLLHGATLCPVPDRLRLDGPQFVAWLGEQRIASSYVPPFLLSDLRAAAQAGTLPGLRRLLVGVEPIPEALLVALRHGVPGLVVLNGYGPTETTVCATVYQVGLTAQHETTPIGSPLRGVTLFVLDEQRRLLPHGAVGELWIGGAGVAAGYWRRPDLEGERFVDDPHAERAGARMYRSGDRVRWLSDGTLAFLGRNDSQVKLRGQRIELGEVESALRCIDGVRDAAAAVQGHGDTRQLVGYVVGDVAPQSVADLLRARLPAGLVPTVIQALPSLPLSPNGKLDRRALPLPPAASRGTSAPRGPRSAVEATLAALWSGLLGVSNVAGDDDFFALGGHSLLATRARQQIEAAFGVRLPVAALFTQPTLAALARQIESERDSTVEPHPPMCRVRRDAMLSVSPQQLRLWLMHQLDPLATAYHVIWAAWLDGPLDPAALQAALDAMVHRHEALRTSFHDVDGVPHQRVHSVGTVAFERRTATAKTLDRQLDSLAQVPFDLGHAPLLRAHLLQLAPTQHVLLLATHHIVFDGVHETFLKELGALYTAVAEGRDPALPEPGCQPADLAAWQLSALSDARRDALVAHWRGALAGELSPLALPTDRPRPPRPSGRGARHHFQWPDALAAKLRGFGKAHGVTSFTTVLTAFEILLSRLSGQARVHVGTPVVQAAPECAGVVGCLVNTLVLRGDFAANPCFADAVEQTRQRTLDALLHEDLPFNLLVAALQPPHDPSRNPLVQAMFVLQPDPLQPTEWGQLAVRPMQVDAGGARLDLLLSVWEGESTLGGCIEYATDLFDRSTMERLTAHLGVLLDAALDEPTTRIQDLPLLSPAQRQLQLQGWNDTAAPAPFELLHQAFERQAALRPDATALITPDGTLGFGELDRAANRVARALRARGVSRGGDVAVMMPRGAELVMALLGVLKVGAAYVPLESGLPPARAARILDTLQVRLLVTATAGLDAARSVQAAAPSLDTLLAIEDCSAYDCAPLATLAEPSDVAYTIFTSGSTGVPKGVRVQHAPAVNLCDWVNRSFGVGPGDRLFFVTSPSFDLSVYDIFGALGAGAGVRVATDAELRDPERLYRVLKDEGITFWDSAPATLQQLEPLFEVPGAPLPALRLVFLSGDWIPVQLPDAVRRAFPRAEVVSLGGATEAAIWSNVFRIGHVEPGWASIPYGRPIRNARYYVLDARLQPQPVGVAGDLYIGGDCLALGYAAAPALTADRFTPDPFGTRPGARMYRTGDLARMQADGTMIFLGRSDFQVKVRGFRVETGEIEAVLCQHPAIAAAAVVTRVEIPGSLVAYVVASTPIEAAALRAHAAAQLPDYMLPAAFVAVDALPMNANGKLDRQALPAPLPIASALERIAPCDALEAQVHRTWAAVLGHGEFGVTDNFFEIGGHSLGAFQVVSRLRAAHGVDLPLRELFLSPTVRTLSACLRAAEALAATACALPAATTTPVFDLADLLDDIATDTSRIPTA